MWDHSLQMAKKHIEENGGFSYFIGSMIPFPSSEHPNRSEESASSARLRGRLTERLKSCLPRCLLCGGFLEPALNSNPITILL